MFFLPLSHQNKNESEIQIKPKKSDKKADNKQIHGKRQNKTKQNNKKLNQHRNMESVFCCLTTSLLISDYP